MGFGWMWKQRCGLQCWWTGLVWIREQLWLVCGSSLIMTSLSVFWMLDLVALGGLCYVWCIESLLDLLHSKGLLLAFNEQISPCMDFWHLRFGPSWGTYGGYDASVLWLIEDGRWNSSLAAVASSSKGGVNVWTPFAMRACCFLWCSVAEFCELLSSCGFLRFLCLGAKCCKWILPLLMVFYAWTTDIVYPTTVIWFWCSYHTYLQWFWLHIREEPVFLVSNASQFQFQKMSCSFVEFVKRCDVFETFLLHLWSFCMKTWCHDMISTSLMIWSLDVASVATFVYKVFFATFRLKEAENNQ